MKGIFFQSNNKSSAADNSSPSSIFSNYWSSMRSSTIRLKRACIDESLDHYITKSRLLLKILAACISIALIGFIISSSLHRAPHHRHQLLINKTIKNDSSDNGSAVEHSPATTDVAAADNDDAIFNDSSLFSHIGFNSPDISSTQNEHQLPRKHSNEEIAFTKSYVREFIKNFNFSPRDTKKFMQINFLFPPNFLTHTHRIGWKN